MLIFAVETSCDETACAVGSRLKILSNVVYSQAVHSKWGGVVPHLAKKEHEIKLPSLINLTMKKLHRVINDSDFDNITAFAVTYGPGLAPALETGIRYVKSLAYEYNKPIVPVNHLEGHIYSVFVQNSKGRPEVQFDFPYLCLIISGGHTQLSVFNNHLSHRIIGKTLDDAAGEALDKAGKLLGLGYPAGAVIERLAESVENQDVFKFPRTMVKHKTLDFSFSGLKTSFYYFIKEQNEQFVYKNVAKLASSFQQAVFDSVLLKLELAIKQTGIKNLIVSGGVSANKHLRAMIRSLAKKHGVNVLFPHFKYLYGDNAAMIAVAGYFRYTNGFFITPDEFDTLDRMPRLNLEDKFLWKVKK
ncbi:MAG: tRNA N6-adenosine threonylcarbamoyltransferase [Patescibacteria group bacterium]|nr:MAG: tRNA N6-adenosine threonylcarbamoyltransferase [Patescibacteria group bacterium]